MFLGQRHQAGPVQRGAKFLGERTFDLDVARRIGNDFELPGVAVQADLATLFRRQFVRRRIAASAAGELGLGREVFELGDGLGQQSIAVGIFSPQRDDRKTGHARRAELQEIAPSYITVFFENPRRVVHVCVVT